MYLEVAVLDDEGNRDRISETDDVLYFEKERADEGDTYTASVHMVREGGHNREVKGRGFGLEVVKAVEEYDAEIIDEDES